MPKRKQHCKVKQNAIFNEHTKGYKILMLYKMKIVFKVKFESICFKDLTNKIFSTFLSQLSSYIITIFFSSKILPNLNVKEMKTPICFKMITVLYIENLCIKRL